MLAIKSVKQMVIWSAKPEKILQNLMGYSEGSMIWSNAKQVWIIIIIDVRGVHVSFQCTVPQFRSMYTLTRVHGYTFGNCNVQQECDLQYQYHCLRVKFRLPTGKRQLIPRRCFDSCFFEMICFFNPSFGLVIYPIDSYWGWVQTTKELCVQNKNI